MIKQKFYNKTIIIFFVLISVQPPANSFNQLDPLGSTVGKLSGVTTAWSSLKEIAIQIKQLEQLFRMTKSQIKTAEHVYNNFRVGRIRDATTLVREMNSVESLVSYTNNLLIFGFSIDDRIERNILKLQNAISGEEYRKLLEENKKLKKKRNELKNEQVASLMSEKNQAIRQKRIENIQSLSKLNNDETITSEKRKQLTNEILVEMSGYLSEINNLLKIQTIQQIKNNNNNNNSLKNPREDLINFFHSNEQNNKKNSYGAF